MEQTNYGHATPCYDEAFAKAPEERSRFEEEALELLAYSEIAFVDSQNRRPAEIRPLPVGLEMYLFGDKAVNQLTGSA